jgi:hypothetical protein
LVKSRNALIKCCYFLDAFVGCFITTNSQRYGLILTGAPALTSRQLKEADFVKVVELLDRGVAIAALTKQKSGRGSSKWNCIDLQDLWYLILGDTSALSTF